MQHRYGNIFKIGLVQVGTIVVLALLLLFDSSRAAYSLLLGGLCCLLPNLLFLHRFFQYRYARQVKQITRAFYQGEVFKMIFIGLLSLLVFINIPIEPILFFSGFIVAQISFWIGSSLWAHKLSGVRS